MKRIDFLVTDSLDRQIKGAMLRLGIGSKAEFFRVLALNCIKDLNIPSTPSIPKLQHKADPALTKDEKILLNHLQNGPQSIDALVEKTGFSLPEVSATLTHLALKNCAVETGLCWTAI